MTLLSVILLFPCKRWEYNRKAEDIIILYLSLLLTYYSQSFPLGKQKPVCFYPFLKCKMHCKDDEGTPRHELIAIMLTDTHQNRFRPITLLLERTVSPDNTEAPVLHFTDHPDHKSILASIAKTFQDMTESVTPFTRSSFTYKLVTDRESTSYLSFFNFTSLNSATALHMSTRSLSTMYCADDSFIGGNNNFCHYLP